MSGKIPELFRTKIAASTLGVPGTESAAGMIMAANVQCTGTFGGSIHPNEHLSGPAPEQDKPDSRPRQQFGDGEEDEMRSTGPVRAAAVNSLP